MNDESDIIEHIRVELKNNKVYFKKSVCEGKDYLALMLNGQIVGAEVIGIFNDGIICNIHFGAGFKAYIHKPSFAVMNKTFADLIITSTENRDIQKGKIN